MCCFRFVAKGEKLEDRSCVFFDNEPGWQCLSGDCIPIDWVCDSNDQCLHPDNSDETIGCNLYPGIVVSKDISLSQISPVKCHTFVSIRKLFEPL